MKFKFILTLILFINVTLLCEQNRNNIRHTDFFIEIDTAKNVGHVQENIYYNLSEKTQIPFNLESKLKIILIIYNSIRK